MARLSIPKSLHEVTPSWLTEALHYKLPSTDASVKSYTAESIGEGKGFMNQITRLRLSYDNEPKDLPREVILKLPSTDPDLRAISEMLGVYQREVRFYEEIAANANLPTPYSYFSAADPATGHTVILLEDLGNAGQGDSVVGCSQKDAQLAISQLAKFHASWWENPQLEHLDWMPLKDAESSIYQELYAHSWKRFVQIAGDGMPGELRELGGRLSQHIPTVKAKLTVPPRTIVHGDYRLDNCFLGTPTNSQSIVVFDWEYCARGRGTYDVATFISEAFPPQRRRNEEMSLLRMYHSLLIEDGIQNYSYEDCLLDYRLSMLEIFMFWISAGGYCDFEGDRATIFLHNSLERFNAAIADLDCVDLLSV